MAYSPKPKTCVWFSRHPPEPAQHRSLSEYDITVINPTGRAYSAVDAWTLITNRIQKPDLIMAVLPLGMLQTLVDIANTHGIPVIQARPQPSPNGRKRDKWTWSGKWDRVVKVEKLLEEWTP